MWGLAKNFFQKKALLRNADFDNNEFESLVLESLHFYDDKMRNILRANRAYLLSYLNWSD